MFRYVLKRILFFIPTLFLISLLAFVISTYAPGKPEKLAACDALSTSASQTLEECEANAQRIRVKFNLHLPLFYFRLASLAEPDTLHCIAGDDVRATLSRLLHHTGNWAAVQDWHMELQHLKSAIAALRHTTGLNFDQQQQRTTLVNINNQLIACATPAEIEATLARLRAVPLADTLLPHALDHVQRQYEALRSHTGSWKTYMPWIFFHGTKNQYHAWLTGLLRLDFGNSFKEPYAPVARQIGDHFLWSFLMTLFSVLLAYLISIPLGLLAAAGRNRFFDRASGLGVLALDALPSFLVATLLMIVAVHVFRADYVSLGMMDTTNHNIWTFMLKNPERLVLPLIAYTYGALAFLSRTMRSSMLEILQQDYIRAARAKGLPEWKVLTRHALKNALIPIITVFGNVFPALISGSVILESIFSIPGMGRATLDAMRDNDMPMIVAVFTITGFLTILGYLITDLLYALIDPRIRHDR